MVGERKEAGKIFLSGVKHVKARVHLNLIEILGSLKRD